jgi:hypothetical protein
MMEEEFEPITLKAFRHLALDGVSGADSKLDYEHSKTSETMDLMPRPPFGS